MSAEPSAARRAVEDRARRDLGAFALGAALALSFAVGAPWAALPQAVAAGAVLVLGSRVERFALGLAGRLALLAGAVLYAILPAGPPPTVLARFLAALVTVSLLRPKAPREHGFVLMLLVLETAAAAALAFHWGAAPAGVLLLVLAHRAVGSWHVRRAAGRAVAAGGPAVLRSADPTRRRSADAASLAVLALTVPLFLVLPRTHVPFLALPGAQAATEPGVSEEVRLGALGALANRDEVVGRVAPLDEGARARDPYFRAVTMDTFDGTRWSARRGRERRWTEYDGDLGVGEVHGRQAAATGPRWLFVVDAAAAPRLVLPEAASRIRFRDPVPLGASIDAAGTIQPHAGRPVSRWVYEVEASPSETGASGPDDLPTEAFLEPLPPALRATLAPAVAEVLAGAEDAPPRTRALRLVAWIRATCTYSLTEGPGGPDPVGNFLFRTRQGHCEHFASALALALREAGIPARLVAGYHATRWNEVGRFWVLRRRDAHAWVEAWLGAPGWVRLEATPPGPLDADPYTGWAGFLTRLRDAVAFTWSRTVLGYDRDAQEGALRTVRDAASAAGARLARVGPAIVAGSVLAAAAGILLARARRRRRARTGRVPAAPRLDFYARALAILTRRGIVRRPGETPAEFARRAGGLLAPVGARALGDLTERFVACRYGGRPEPDEDRARDWIAHLAGGTPTPRR